MNKEVLENFQIPDSAYVTVTQTKHITEVQYMQRKNLEMPIIKLNADTYLVKSTGEIKDFEHAETRADDLKSVRSTLKKLRYLINNNFDGATNELFLTLTYKENMTDRVKLMKDFEKFMKKLKYRYRNNDIDYLSVVEPQERGAFHFHVLLRFNDLRRIFIPNSEIADIWGHGFVHARRIDSVDNVGAYLSAYLADLTIDVDEEVEGAVIKKVFDANTNKMVSKKVLKGARMYLYPSGMNIYRKSRGIKMPVRNIVPYNSIKKERLGKKTFESAFQISDAETEFENIISYQYYNANR